MKCDKRIKQERERESYSLETQKLQKTHKFNNKKLKAINPIRSVFVSLALRIENFTLRSCLFVSYFLFHTLKPIAVDVNHICVSTIVLCALKYKNKKIIRILMRKNEVEKS